MRAALLCLTALSLLSLIALRPAQPTIPERVADLERRVTLLEAAVAPKQPPAQAVAAGDIVLGMTEAQVRESLARAGRSANHRDITEVDGLTRQTWYLNADPADARQAKRLIFENGVVVKVFR